MSTSCRIAIKLPNGSYRSIYCHFDGYEDGVGKILNQNYATEDAANWLINLGDLRSISHKTIEIFLSEDHRQIGPTLSRSPTELSILAFEEDCVDYLYVFEDGIWEIHQ